MASEQIIQAVCLLPRTLKVASTKSISQLLLESGYFAQPETVTSDAIRAFLRSNLHLIQDWLDYSADKRTSTGWFFTEGPASGERTYFVGYYPGGDRMQYTRIEEACTSFILHEIDQIRANAA